MELLPSGVQNSGKVETSVSREKGFPAVYATVEYEIAVCPFSCDRAETEVIFLSSTTKRNILCVAPFRRCLKCNLIPFMNFGLHTSRHSNRKMPYTLSS
jgi:hypothetical protein